MTTKRSALTTTGGSPVSDNQNSFTKRNEAPADAETKERTTL
jgi:hypothetical protein